MTTIDPCGPEHNSPETTAGEVSLDPAAVLARMGGNGHLLQELVTMFLEDCPKWMAEIRERIARADMSRLVAAVHQLRGSVGNFGITSAYEKARQLEVLARTGDLTSVARVYPLLEEAICQFQKALTKVACVACALELSVRETQAAR